MNPTELKMSNTEIALIKNKVTKVKFFSIILIAFFLVWLWFWTDKETPYSLLDNGISIFIAILLLIFIFFLSKKLLVTRNDIKNQIKIIDEFKVIEKYIDRSKVSRYYIVFNSKVLNKYQVTKNVYEVINVTDSVYIEYSKHANWILKISHNNIDIENKSMIA